MVRIGNYLPRINEYKLSLWLTLVFSVCVCALSYALYLRASQILGEQVDARLLSIVKTAAGRFDEAEILHLQQLNPKERVRSPLYKKVILTLQDIQRQNPEVTFAYIQGKSDTSDFVEFIADANAIAMRPSLNFNEDSISVESYPGSLYDISEEEAFADDRPFQAATVDAEFYDTIWGTLKTAYAPISSEGRKSDFVLAIDINNAEYNEHLRLLTVPFGLFALCTFAFIVSLMGIVSKLWREKVEWLQESNAQKNDVLNIVSHQLHTPISGLKASLEMISDGDFGMVEPQVKQQLEKMNKVIHHMADLVKMLLETARLEGGRSKIQREAVKAQDILFTVISQYSHQANEKGISIECSVDEDGHGTCEWDKRLMHMAWENILSNAIKYSPQNSSILVHLSHHEEKITLTVKDFGHGIPEEEKHKIFRKLYRASNAKSQGHGIGLHASKMAIEAHGGNIHFLSKVGVGTTFIVEVPKMKK